MVTRIRRYTVIDYRLRNGINCNQLIFMENLRFNYPVMYPENYPGMQPGDYP